MRTAMAIAMIWVLAAVCGCQSSSPRGGTVSKTEGFRIAVPTVGTSVTQGELQTVTVALRRGRYFKQDVRLETAVSSGNSAVSNGITVEPNSLLVKASDKPEAQLQIKAARDAALGEYRVTVKGTPQTGTATAVGFRVKVVAP